MHITSELIAARPYLFAFSPGPSKLFTSRVARAVFAGFGIGSTVRKWRAGAPMSTLVGEHVGSRLIAGATRPVRAKVARAHVVVARVPKRDFFRKNGLGGRSWYDQPGRHQMVIVFHDANRAGPHIDVHIGRLSMIYRVKPDLYAQLKYNNQGMLTEASRMAIINHVRSEIAAGARVPQNLDHSLSNAHASWVGGDPEGRNYGDGRTRQVVAISTVDVYKAEHNGPIELYAPLLNPHRSQYLYRLYPGDGKRAPIIIWGNRTNQPPALEDRLHLKMMDPRVVEDKDLPITKVDWDTATAKYDGASCYVVITPKGTTVWSPRQSVKTGEQIEYTHKLNGIANIRSDETIVAMGELLFRPKPTWKQRLFSTQPAYLPSATGSGILNSNLVLPNNVEPEIRLYRVDRMGKERTGNLDFWSNRALQEEVANLGPKHLKVVERMTPDRAAELGFEGVVAVPARPSGIMLPYEDGEQELYESASVNDGVKIKWWMDPNDWRIDAVEFKPGDKGGIAGVVRATSLESGKKFNLGPGQVGDRALTEAMMADPERYVGTVLKVNSRHGHEGRAAKVIAFHDDKGLAPV